MVKKFLILIILFSGFLHSLQKSNLKSLNSYDGQGTGSVLSSVTSLNNHEAENENLVFASLPSFDQQMKTSLKIDDARPEIIRQYLKKYESPLEPLAQLIVDLADENNYDYRWMVAIAQQESNLCKKIPENSFNCWGWGIYGTKVTRFDSYEEAMRRIAPQFTKIFLKGDHNKDPMVVMKTYTPPSDGSWANGVSAFFEHLE